MANFISNGFNIGPDASVSLIYRPTGQVLPSDALGILMEITAEQKAEAIIVEPITDGGKPALENYFLGWSGSLNFTRVIGALTGIFATMSTYFYAGGRPKWDVQVSVSNIDGSLDEYLFTQCVFTRPQFGRFRARAAVEQSLTFDARDMIVVAGPAALISLAA